MSLAFVLSALVSAAPASRGDVYAVVVGHNGGTARTDSSRGLPTLRFADDDALRMARWFSGLAVEGGVTVLTTPDAQTTSTLDAAGLSLPKVTPPTRTALSSALASLKTTLAKRPPQRGPSTVFFFYAGHGLTGRLLLEPEAGDDASITGKELKLALMDLGADHVELFIDACRSQSLFTDRGGPDLSQEIATLEARAASTSFGVITAAQSDKPAGEASDLMGGFFSHVLASGLAGAADADGDDVVRFGELAAFVAFNTEGLTGQRPWFEPPGGDLRAPVIALSGTTRLVLPETSQGRLRISSPSGLPIFAELFKPAGRRMTLTLPSGRYQVQRRDGETGGAADIELVTGEARTLSALVDATMKRTAERGELDWEPVSFQGPFSPQVVAALDAGYVSGRPNVAPSRARTFALDAAYLLSPTPFGFPGLEHGVELGARYHLGGVQLGLRGAFRSSTANDAILRRIALNLRGGWRFLLLDERLALAPFGSAGFKTILRLAGAQVTGDPFAPSLGAGLHVEGHLLPRLSLWAEGRFEATWVQLDGVRVPFAEPAVTMGASLWW
ncbi:MAG: caspase family protein [Myxococcales bacterium]|nr:caspase family protein [Myxococcales bacterium]